VVGVSAVTEDLEASHISGRAEPRLAGYLPPCDVRYSGAVPPNDPGIVAECRPCRWRRWIANGHTDAELARLTGDHAGQPT
jgi:hypothetical protein